MPKFHVIPGPDSTPVYPGVRKIGPADLKDALAKGYEDFVTMPSSLIFLGLIYPIVGIGSLLAVPYLCSSRSCRVSLSLAPLPRLDCMRLAGAGSLGSTSRGRTPSE